MMSPEVENLFRMINEELEKVPEEKREEVTKEFLQLMWQTIVDATFGAGDTDGDGTCEQCAIRFDDSDGEEDEDDAELH